MVRISDERALWLSRHVLPHEPALRNWLRRRRVDGLEVDDVVQETYARLIALESVSAIGNVRNYLFQTAWSVLMTHVRRARIVSFQTLSDLDQVGAQAPECSPEAHAIGRDELHRLAAAIAGLPGKIREVFILRRVNGLPQREVALRVGLSESTVEKHMSRGIYLLMTHLSHGGNEAPRASEAWARKAHKGRDRRDRKTHRSGD